MSEEVKKEEHKKEKKTRTLFQKIVNVFLYIGLGILILIIVALGITQTSTFREFLRETVIEEVNGSLYGKLYIEKIDGTILTSIILRNTNITLHNDTILFAEKIEAKTSPLQLLFKKIFVRKLEIQNADIHLTEEKNGKLNISNLMKPTAEDTLKSEFPFTIEVADFKLTNVDFSLQRYDYLESTYAYDSLYLRDFRIKNLNLSLSAFADITRNRYEIDIDRFSLDPNLNNFSLKELSGSFKVNESEIIASDFKLVTQRSNVEINAVVKGFNIFDSTAELNTSRINLRLLADKFDFGDLSLFAPSMNILQGEIKADIQTEGTMKELGIGMLVLSYGNTNLGLSGSIRNLDDPDKMYISANFSNSYIDQSDLKNLMPSVDIPKYDDLGVIKFDTLVYNGNPQDFHSKLYVTTEEGRIYADAKINMRKADMEYDVKFATFDFNIFPFAGITSNLDSRGEVKGTGTSPERMNSTIYLTADGSEVDGHYYNAFTLKADAKNKRIDYLLNVRKDTSGVDLTGMFDFTDKDNPSYNLGGYITKLNVEDFTKDTLSKSNLNIELTAEGKSFDLENLNLYMTLKLFDADVNGYNIDSTRAIIDVRKEESGRRVISIVSDLADISFIGNYSINKTIKIIGKEVNLITSAVNNKMNEIIPASIDSLKEISQEITRIEKEVTDEEEESELQDSVLSIDYLIDFKDFSLASIFLPNANIEVIGEITGKIRSERDSLSVTMNTAIEKVRYRDAENVYLVSNLSLDVGISNSLNMQNFDELNADLDLKFERVFAGTDIKNLNLDLGIHQNSSHINFEVQVEDYASAKINGGFGLSGNTIELLLDSLVVDYKKFVIRNRDQINIIYADDRIEFKKFTLLRNEGMLDIKGILSKGGNQDLTISLDKINVSELLATFSDIRPENSITAAIGLKTRITGSLEDPIIDLNLNIDSVTYKNRNFGSLITALDYSNKNMKIDVNFVNPGIKETPAFSIKGNVPINLALTGEVERFPKNESMDIRLTADEFDLATFGDLLPQVNRLSGSFTSGISIKGTPEQINQQGFIEMKDVKFIAEANNLEYYAGIKINFEGNNINLDSLVISNGADVKDGGTIAGTGTVTLEGFGIKTVNLTMGGRLRLLSPENKGSLPFYGSMVILTKENIEFQMNEERTFIKASILAKKVNVTIPPSRGAYANNDPSFVYRNIEDTAMIPVSDFENLIMVSKRGSGAAGVSPGKNGSLDLDLNVEIEKEATVIFVLSKEINQNLTAVLGGELDYAKIGGRTDIQGELMLLEGSTLEFIKTFSADGTIRFENDITNPFVDITATYMDYYNEGDSVSASSEIQVAVKIKIKGLAQELDKNFVAEENNIAVYYGEDNIEKDQPDPTKDASDALMFIVTGKFAEDLSQSEQTAAASQVQSQATAIAGSVIGGVLNRYMGSYVTNVELRRVGTETKILVSGKAGNFKYSVGGTTDVFEDISQANVRIEYPIIQNLLLRFERKEDLTTESNIRNEMVNEVGLKYRFEF